MADDAQKIKVPPHFEKRILAAYLLIMGETWKTTSAKIGRTEATIAAWKKDTYWWSEAKRIAEERWLYDLTDASREAVMKQVKAGDGNMALSILERLDERLRPAKLRLDAEHRGAIEIMVRYADSDTD